jgi:hypothetical protein
MAALSQKRKVGKMRIEGNARARQNQTVYSFFGLTNKAAQIRNQWKAGILIVVLFVLSAITIVPASFEVKKDESPVLFIAASFLKYILLLYFAYYLAKKRAAHYLDDIFELKNESLAEQFIEKVAFGGNQERVTINKGKISREDESSSLILIGGPGEIMVHMGDVAIVETIEGEPKILTSKNEAWEIGSFERIREIGQYDDIGRREYAIINLRDQFVSGLEVITRTKDGICLQIKDIKLFFSVLRENGHEKNHTSKKNPFSFDKNAVLSLVYNQTVMNELYEIPTSIKFPWNTTVIPLIITELEEIIRSKTLSEILASISQKEIEEIIAQKTQLDQILDELNIEPTEEKKPPASPPNFMPRSMFTDHFTSPSLKEKAANLGISIKWIDIGTWELKYDFLTDKLKEAREVRKKNEKREKEIKHHEDKLTKEKTGELIKKVIIENIEKTVTLSELARDDLKELAERIKKDPELASPQLLRHLVHQTALSKAEKHKTLSTLKSFRTELLAAKEIINKENKSPLDKEIELKAINNALRNIENQIFRYLGKK